MDRRAIIVGVNKYPRLSTSKCLRGAENDAKELSKILKEFGDFDVTTLVGRNATNLNIRKELNKVFKKDEKAFEIVVFFFAGHGIVGDSGIGYIAPSDMIAGEPFVNGINMKDIDSIVTAYFNSYSVNDEITVIIILDCCYSGIISNTRTRDSGSEISRKDFETLVEKSFGEGKYYLCSCAETQKAKEITNCKHKQIPGRPHSHGAFWYCLIEALSGDASDTKGDIMLDALLRETRQKMKNLGGDQKFTSSATMLGDLASIRISTSSNIRSRKITDLLSKSRFQRAELASILDAASILQEIFAIDPNQKEAQKIKLAINKEIARIHDKVAAWLRDNKKRYYDINKSYPKLYQKLGNYCEVYLSNHDDFLKLRSTMKSGKSIELSLLEVCCDMSHEPDLTEKYFKAQIATYIKRDPLKGGIGSLTMEVF